MKKTVIALAAAAMTAPLAANAETSWFGFSQITAEMGEGVGNNNGTADNPDYSNDGLRFGGDRIRIGYKASEGDAFAKLQVDFLQNTSASSGQTPNIIKDAVVGYKLADAAKISLGQFKTPVGMDFNTSGKKLDITKRGMEKGLVLERSAGAMLSGDLAGGLGYDIGLFNPMTRSSVVSGGDVGEDVGYAGRVRFDMDNLHLQASYGTSPNAGYSAGSSTESCTTYNVDLDGDGNDDETVQGDCTTQVTGANLNSEDYTVMDVGAKYTMDPLTLKFEYIAGSNVRGVDGWDETVMFLHGGYMLNDSTEVVARHYMGNNDNNGTETDMSNTYVGANFFLNGAMRIQANYVMASGDTDGAYGGARGGYDSDAILTQFQYTF